MNLQCGIRATDKGGLIQLAPWARASETVRGRYTMSVSKSSSSGSTENRQSGEAELRAGEEQVLSVAAINAEPGAKLSARLDVQTEFGVCHADFILPGTPRSI